MNRVLVGWLALALYSIAFSPCSAEDSRGFVGYIARVIPSGVSLADVAMIKRDGKELRLTGVTADLAPNDQIFMKRSDAMLIVRILADNRVIVVQKVSDRSAQQADMTVPSSSLQGLTGKIWAWAKGVYQGADDSGPDSVPAASRTAYTSGKCYNDTGKTNDPLTFQIPILMANTSVIAAGRRSVFVSWRGGAPPFLVRLSKAETGESVTADANVRDSCAVRLPPVDLVPGHYRLTVTDANNVSVQEENLLVAEASPEMPEALRAAKIPDEARQLYFANWLTLIDAGKWAFEAQQHVAAMNCKSLAVQDWLKRWGGYADLHTLGGHLR